MSQSTPTPTIRAASWAGQAAARDAVVDGRVRLLALLGVVFYAATLIAYWVAPDRDAALARLAGITLGLAAAAAIAWLGRRSGGQLVGWTGLGCLLLAVLISSYFLLTYDWQAAGGGKLAVVQRLGLWLQAHRPALRLPLQEDINGNVAGGALVILLPLGLGGAYILAGRNTRRMRFVIPMALSLLIVAPALLLSLSRGAWLALVAALLASLYLYWRQGQASDRPMLDGVVFAAIIALSAGSFLLAIAGFGPIEAMLGLAAGAGGSAIGRAALWRDMLTLARDYIFTGSGLGATTMAFSSYVLMLHVRFITHAHQLFLQVAVEQGLIAFLAFAGMVIVSLWALLRSPAASRSGPFPAVAALAALVALAVHGMTDAGIYVSRIAPVIFLPFGFAVAAWGTPAARRPGRGPTRPGLWLAIGLACVVLLLMALPSVRAAWQANLGAVAQTRAELSVYHWPEWPIQDAVRRANPAILEPALRRYDAALELDPQNVTANRRLGQIELSLGRYAEAERHIAAAYKAAPGDRAGRQLLGEIKAISGATEEAAALWHSVNLAQRQPDSRQWWYNDIGEPEKAALIERAARQAGW